MSSVRIESYPRAGEARVEARLCACSDFASIMPGESWIGAPAFQPRSQDAFGPKAIKLHLKLRFTDAKKRGRRPCLGGGILIADRPTGNFGVWPRFKINWIDINAPATPCPSRPAKPPRRGPFKRRMIFRNKRGGRR